MGIHSQVKSLCSLTLEGSSANHSTSQSRKHKELLEHEAEGPAGPPPPPGTVPTRPQRTSPWRAAGCPCLALPPLGKKLQHGCRTHPRVGLGHEVGQEVGQGSPHLSGMGGFRCSSRPQRATSHPGTPPLLRHPRRTPLATACAPPKVAWRTAGVEPLPQTS